LSANTGILFSLSFGPAGGKLLTATHKATAPKRIVRVWGVGKKGDGTATPAIGAATEPRAAWSPDGKRIVATSAGVTASACVWAPSVQTNPRWSASHHRLTRALGLAGKAPWMSVGVAFHSDNDVLACWGRGGSLKVARIDIKKNTIKLLPTAIP